MWVSSLSVWLRRLVRIDRDSEQRLKVLLMLQVLVFQVEMGLVF